LEGLPLKQSERNRLSRDIKPRLEFIKKMYTDHPSGFYVRAKDRIYGTKGLLKYIARYIRHPAIAECRIDTFDEETVVFHYDDDNKVRHEVVMPVFEFIEALLNKIPEKGTHVVKSYGLYSNRKRRKYAKILEKLGKLKRIIQESLQSWIPTSVRCPKCGKPMENLGVFPPPDVDDDNIESELGSRIDDWVYL